MNLPLFFQRIKKSANSTLCSKWTYFIKLKMFLQMYTKRLHWLCDGRKISIAVAIVVIAVLAILPIFTQKKVRYVPCQVHPSAHNPDRFKLDNSGPPFADEIVPNIVHFYRTGSDIENFSLVDAICLMAAYHFAKPDKIMIHTDDPAAVRQSLTASRYGKRLLQNSGFSRKLEIQHWPAPKHVFGIEFSAAYRDQHVRDVTKLRILRKYGGVFLDNNAYIVQDPGMLRHYEMVVLESGRTLSNAMVVAHRDSRMLDLWLKSYHRYDPSLETHHLSAHVRALFEKKQTLSHQLQNVLKSGGVRTLMDSNGLLATDFYSYYVLQIETKPDRPTEMDTIKTDMDNDYLFTLMEKMIS